MPKSLGNHKKKNMILCLLEKHFASRKGQQTSEHPYYTQRGWFVFNYISKHFQRNLVTKSICDLILEATMQDIN